MPFFSVLELAVLNVYLAPGFTVPGTNHNRTEYSAYLYVINLGLESGRERDVRDYYRVFPSTDQNQTNYFKHTFNIC